MDKNIDPKYKALAKNGKIFLMVGAPIFIIGCIASAVFSVMSYSVISYNEPIFYTMVRNTSFAIMRNISLGVFAIGAVLLFIAVAIDQKIGTPLLFGAVPSKKATADGEQIIAESEQDLHSGYFNLVLHVILLLCTFGIWNLIWIYRTTSYLNILKSEPPRSPVKKLLLYIFLPFYSYYWIYKSAKRIDDLGRENGKLSDTAALCLILAIFIGIVPPIIMQHKINQLAES